MRALLRGLVLLLLLPALGSAQRIRGVVVEDSTSRPIPDATIEIVAADGAIRATSTSAITGWFSLPPQSGGQQLLRARHPAYRIDGAVSVVAGPDETITVVIRLGGGPIPIDPVIARATRGRLAAFDERARRGAYGNFITRADIDKRGGYSLSHMLRFTPEVRIERVRDGAFMSDGVFMRSFGELCIPSIFLDGMPLPRGSAFDIDMLLSLEAVEGIEVYRSALSAPMEFRMGFDADQTCGVIAVWSRQLPRGPLTFKRVMYAGLLVSSSILFMRIISNAGKF